MKLQASWGEEFAMMNQLRSILIANTAALLSVPQIATADVVTDWNTIAINTVSADRVKSTPKP
jgi:hypothetical protein